MYRKTLLTYAVGLALTVSLTEGSATTNNFPANGKPIHIVTLIAGGAPDIFSRIVGQELMKQLGVPVVVENKPGAGGNIAAAFVANATPDGYTLLMSSPILAIAPYIMPVKFDPLKDLVPVAGIAETEFVVLVNKSLKARTLHEFINIAKQRPTELNYATNIGSPVQYATLQFEQQTGIKMTAVPYKGSSEGQLALARGDVDAMIDVMPSSLPNMQAGRVLPLAVASEVRSKYAPKVPTAKEQGLDYITGSWNGLFAPAGTPPEIIEKLSAAIGNAMKKPEFAKQIESVGALAKYRNPQELGKLLESNVSTYSSIRKAQESGKKEVR